MEVITSVSEYLKAVKEITAEQGHIQPFFRGESQLFEKIAPSLYTNNLQQKEVGMIERATLEFPEVFAHCKNDLERLIRMQHFGLPTRLLDITRNPLIALYFACTNKDTTPPIYLEQSENMFEHACNNSSKSNGRVWITQQKQKMLNHVELSAALIDCTPYNTEYTLTLFYNWLQGKGLLNRNTSNEQQYKETWIDIIGCEVVKPHIFQPTYTNPRIRNQQGAFVFVPTYQSLGCYSLSEGVPRKSTAMFRRCDSCNLDEVFHKKYIEVSDNSKSTILDELEWYGITEGFVFPDEEHQMSYIKKSFLRKQTVFDIKLDE